MMAALVLFSLLLWDLELDRIWGAVLVLGMLAASLVLVRWARRDARLGEGPAAQVPDDGEVRVWVEWVIGFGALALTLLGADLLVRGATRLAVELDISAAFVGLVIVSVGTSLPELATAMAAARRNETDLILGNVLGSNLFNTLMVAGTAALVGPGDVDPSFRTALLFMLGAGAGAGFFVVTGRRLVRWEGALLLVGFIAFVSVAGVS
jgi:cation:H+ antiporter